MAVSTIHLVVPVQTVGYVGGSRRILRLLQVSARAERFLGSSAMCSHPLLGQHWCNLVHDTYYCASDLNPESHVTVAFVILLLDFMALLSLSPCRLLIMMRHISVLVRSVSVPVSTLNINRLVIVVLMSLTAAHPGRSGSCLAACARNQAAGHSSSEQKAQLSRCSPTPRTVAVAETLRRTCLWAPQEPLTRQRTPTCWGT